MYTNPRGETKENGGSITESNYARKSAMALHHSWSFQISSADLPVPSAMAGHRNRCAAFLAIPQSYLSSSLLPIILS